MKEWTASDIQANGIQIHYHRTGGARPPMLLLHGITDNGLCWTRVARDLRGRYDVLMTDARSHGLSEQPAGRFSFPSLAEDAAGFIRELGLGRPVVWGHSMGAITAAILAANHPDLVQAVVLEDPPLEISVHSLPPEILEQIRQDNLALRSMTSPERLAWAAAQNPGWDEAEIGPWAESKTQFDLAVFEHFGAVGEVPWQDVFQRIQCPGLLLTGDPEKGALVRQETARQALQLWNKLEVVQISGAGHSIHRDRYAETMRAAEGFLDNLGD